MVIIRYLITFSYDGTNYKGLQKLKTGHTIQGVIEDALQKINKGQPVKIYASGRTDAKVHAFCQKAHFDLSLKFNCEQLKKAINNNIPADIYIDKVEVVSADFHARYDVKTKEYVYKINMGAYNPLERNLVYQYNKNLNLIEMERALKFLEGEHDFSYFTSKQETKKDCTRYLLLAHLIKKDDKIMFVFVGTGFLKYQVRNMVAVLMAIGEGKLKSEAIMVILGNKDYNLKVRKAPAVGLYLSNVVY